MIRRAVLLTLAVGAVALGGCSSASSDGDSSTTAPAAATQPTSTTGTQPEAPDPLDDQTPPPSINGITVQGDTIWIASIAGDEVLQVDRATGAILARFAANGAGPDDVAVAPDGSVWVTGFGNGEVGRIADGTYEVVTNIAAGINPIDVADDGTVYIGTFGPNGSLYRIIDDGGFELLATGLPDINGFEVLDDGTIFSPAGGIAGPGSGVLIDPANGEVTTVADGLPGVAAATVDPDGQPFLLANTTGELIAVDLEAGTSKVARTIVTGAPFDNLAFAPDGTLYLANFTSVAITAVSPDGDEQTIAIGS